MHLRTVLYACVLLSALNLAAQAGSVPELISHQGRLLKADGTPESGAHALTFNVYEASSGGVALWTESHPGVVVDEGLFTVLLGSTVPVSRDLLSPPSSGSPVERWLEVTVDGQVLMPRLRLASVPYSSSSSRVDGDVETSPGELRLHGMSGSTTGTIRMTASDGGNEDSTQLYLYARKDGQVTSADFNYKATSSRSSLTMGTDSDGDALHENQLTATATFSDGSTMDITSDPDDDGTPNGQAMMKSIGSTGGIRLGGMSGSTTGTIRMAATPDSTYEDHSSLDNQGFGGHSRGMNSNVRSTALLGVDRDLKSTSIEQDCDESSARGVLSGRSGSTTGTIRMMASPDSTVDYQDMDSDDDGVAESSSKVKTTSSSSSSALSHMSGSTTGTIRMMASSDSTRNYMDLDDDADGFAESDARIRLTPLDAEIGISTDRFGSGPRQTVSMDGSFSHVQSRCISDFDRDGIQDVVVAARSDSSGGGNYLDMDSDDDGLSDCSVRSTVTDDSATVSLNRLPPGTPYIGNFTMSTTGSTTRGVLSGMSGSTTGTIRMAASGPGGGGGGGVGAPADLTLEADLDGDAAMDVVMVSQTDASSSRTTWKGGMSGSTTGTIRMAAAPDSSDVTTGTDSDGDGLDEVAISTKTKSSGGTFHMSGSTTGTIRMDVSSSGPGSTLTIGSVATSHFIDVEGGAYCDGTNWVNASDVASKENFERVDGAKLLDQIADLEITRWNYKGQNGVEHIGPTAQDFQKAFGVGADNKSISTIDPSGIALAAIQELQKQNAELRSQLEALNRKVEQLTATR